jgi:hypothetical protein
LDASLGPLTVPAKIQIALPGPRCPSSIFSYGILIGYGLDRSRNFIASASFVRACETYAAIKTPAFVPQRICPHYHFDIKRSRQGYWIARDRDGLAGGTFVTCKDAVRFALFETGGDSAHVHILPDAKPARIGGARAVHPRSQSLS